MNIHDHTHLCVFYFYAPFYLFLLYLFFRGETQGALAPHFLLYLLIFSSHQKKKQFLDILTFNF